MDPTGQLIVPWDDHPLLGMEGTQVSVLEQSNEASFSRLL